MTAREKNIISIVGVVIFGWLIYYFASQMLISFGLGSDSNSRLIEAERLIRSRPNIIAGNKYVLLRLQELKKRFFFAGDLDKAQVNLLEELEQIAYLSQLNVRQKNIIRFSDTLIGVSLEGEASPESLFRFIQRTTEARIGLRIKRLQLHALPESKRLSYQITISSLLVSQK